MRFQSVRSLALVPFVFAACRENADAVAPANAAQPSAAVQPAAPAAPSTGAPAIPFGAVNPNAQAPAGGGALPSNHPPLAGGGMPGANPHGGMPMAAPPGPPTPAAAQMGPLFWRAPAGWTSVQPRSSMRKAQYTIPGPGPGTEAELNVFFFGDGGGGAIEDNLQRWYGQFTQADGRASQEVAQRSERTVRGMHVVITTVEGRYDGGMGMPGAAAQPQENWALLGAIVETTGGPWFFKMIGPRSTIAANRQAFDALLQTFEFRAGAAPAAPAGTPAP